MLSGRGRGRIRPPRRNIMGHGETGDFEDQWDILKSALKEIHTKNASALSFEQIYRASYKIVLKKQGDRLYERVKEFEEQWFGGVIMPKIRTLITKNLINVAYAGVSDVTANERRMTGEEFLKGLKLSWEDHITTMNMTTDVLMYMDRVYCKDNRKASIFTTAMGLFRDHILRSQFAATGTSLVTFDILNSVLLDQIGMERDGDVIDRALIRSCIYILEGLYESDEENDDERLYLTAFEGEFLNKSRIFYQNICTKLLQDADASTWLRQTKKRLVEEENRCQTTISMVTTPKIAKVVEEEMISKNLNEFLTMEGSGVQAMIENDRYDDLSLLYELIARVDPSKDPLKVALQARVVDLGSEINAMIQSTDFSVVAAGGGEDGDMDGADKSKATKLSQAAKLTAAAIRWVNEVLVLKDKFDRMWKQCFGEDLILQTGLTKSFSDFINQFPRCSEYVSLFIDDNLKRGIKGKTEAEIDVVLDKAVILLRYIQDRDLFERYYKKHLARRLLHNKSESGDVEKQMVSRMKQELGNAFTNKLEGMFKDMTLSEELSSGYRNHIHNLGDLDRRNIDLGINVLTSNYWPMESMGGGGSMQEDGTRTTCNWPNEIKTLQESFKSFYLKERNGRRLTWLGFLGSADVRCVFPKIPGKEGVLGRERRHEISVPTYGMIVMLLFNDVADGGSLSYEEILERTNIPPNDLSRILHTISVLPKARVLNKIPASKDLPRPGDRFTFNTHFTSKSVKIKAPVMVGAVNRVEGDDERRETEDRNDEHRGNVIDTVIVRIMKPDINMMKKRVESLIEREYLERVENAEVPTYSYLA